MHRLLLAIRAAWRILFDARVADRAERLLEAKAEAEPAAAPEPTPAAPPKRAPARSDALTLLATLQREARLVDFLQESLEGAADAQIGSAVREVHRECRQVLQRMFDLQPVAPEDEGTELELPAEFDPERFRLTGRVGGEPPYKGRLVHHGWIARKCELPTWTGGEDAALVVAPAEVEVR